MGMLRTVEPVADAVTIHQAKKACEIDAAATDHDIHLQRLIRASITDFERKTGRALITQTWRTTYRMFRHRFELPRPPLQSVSKIDYIDQHGSSQEVPASDYQVSFASAPAIVEPAYGKTWPSARHQLDAVSIEFICGYGTEASNVPDNIQNAILELVVFRFTCGRGDSQVDYPAHIRTTLEALRIGSQLGFYGVRQ